MEKGLWLRWQLVFGAILAMMCLSCQGSMGPAPRKPLPPPPAVRPEAPPQRPTFYVKVGRLNLRAGPGMDFPKLGLLERNEEVEKLGEAESWYQIRVKRDGTLGWVSSEYLSSTPVTSPIEIPVPETPAPPTAKQAPPPEPKPEKPAKVETKAPREPKPAEAAEPPAKKAKPAEEAAPAPSPATKAAPEKAAPQKEEPPSPPPPPPEEKPSGIRIM